MAVRNEGRIFAPFKALGLVCGETPVCVRYVPDAKLTRIFCAVNNVVHTYRAENLNLTCVSEPLPQNIRCLSCDNRRVFVGYGRYVAALHVHRQLERIYGELGSEVEFILPFGNHLICVDSNSTLKMWEIESGDLYGEWHFGNPNFRISTVCHPATYLNKLLLGSSEGPLKLVNVKTGQLVYDFGGWGVGVTCLQQSPAVDIVAIGLKDGRIILHHLKFDDTITSFRQDWGAVTTVTFRTDGPAFMLTGSEMGHAAVWDLEKRKLANQMLNAHRGSITTLIALQNEPAVVSAGKDNSLKTWVFDLSDGGGRLLNSLEGHASPPTFIRFHAGGRGQFILSAGGDSDVKMFSTANNKPKNLGQAGTMRRKIAKSRHLDWEDYKLPPIVHMASDATRESGWDNVVCCHQQQSLVTTWTSRRTRLGDHKLCHPRFASSRELCRATAVCCTVSACGNFALTGYSSGHVDVFNIQSGIFRGSYVDESKDRAHCASVQGVCVDGVNGTTVTGCAKGKMKFWRFGDKKLIDRLILKSGVVRLVLHRENDLLAACLTDCSLVVVDVECKRVVRLFENAHQDAFTDAAFHPFGQWVLTAGTDKTVKVWDLPSSRLVDVLRFENACTSLTVSKSGDYLATAHANQLGVYLWVNKSLFVPHLILKPLTDDYRSEQSLNMPSSEAAAPGEDGENTVAGKELDMECEKPEQLDHNLITYSDLPTPRWVSLLDMDIIKERNKPKQPLKKPDKAPFFLPTVSGVVPTFDTSTAEKSKENEETETASRLSVLARLQPRSEFASAIENLPAENVRTDAFSLLKKLSPAALEMELRNLSPFNGGSSQLLSKFLLLTEAVFKTKRDFEAASAYLALFVKLHRDVLWSEASLRENLEKAKRAQTDCWNRIDELLNDTLSLVQYMKSSVL